MLNGFKPCPQYIFMDRPDFMLLAIGAGLVTVILAASFSMPRFSRELTKELCEDSGGVWNECGSLCTGEPPGTICADVCVPVCECGEAWECPPGFYCKASMENETGTCAPLFGDVCGPGEECPQPRCPGMHAVCRDGQCVTVNELGALTRCG
jgi:hypothetical protein